MPEPKRLHEPFKGPAEAGYPSLLYRFCRGCELPGEVNDKVARRLAVEAGSPFADSIPTGIYFETDGATGVATGRRSVSG